MKKLFTIITMLFFVGSLAACQQQDRTRDRQNGVVTTPHPDDQQKDNMQRNDSRSGSDNSSTY